MNRHCIIPLLFVLVVLSACARPMPTPTPEPTLPPAPAPTGEPTPPSPSMSAPSPSTQELKVHFIDVGQGDSILIDLNDQEILIDGGEKSSGVTSYISSYVDGLLEAVIATHPHSDHIGGLISVLDSFDVLNIWTSGDSTNSQTYSEFMSAVQLEHANTYVARRGDKINVGGLSFTVLNPDTLNGTTNNNSIVLSLSYGDIDFLFTGDAEKEAEASMLVSSVVPVPDVEILKVGHHGSRTASSHDFLVATSPEVAIYMAGKSNSYGHPHQETITALTEVGAEIYGTDIHGTIVVTTDGETYTLQLEKQAPPCSPPVVSQTPTPSPTPPGANNVQITRIFYDGVVPRVESDEYVEITNLGTELQDLAGWMLKDISEGYPSFTFPHYILEPGTTIRVYTNEIHPEWGGFSFGYGKAIWNNTEPDMAALYNAQGQEVSRKSY